ncbi:MAG: hypothetical protein ACO1NQ_06715 [Flavobacteriales bacterium]
MRTNRTLFRSLSVALFVALVSLTSAQTYFFISSITTSPSSPTTASPISISVNGDLSSSGSFIVSAEHTVIGNEVHITIFAATTGGLTVLVPHTEVLEIGQLPAGEYEIIVDGTAILDSAPEPDHFFTVNAGGGHDCGTLTVESIQWATFNDTSVVVNVTNSADGFDYPGFILLNQAGDTLALEAVNLFAIGAESWHTLTVDPDAEMPTGPFSGQLQLWTNFYEELACTWDVQDQLCPEDDCVTIFPYLINTGGAIALGDFDWTITDANGSVAASGTITLTMKLPSVQEEVCLPVGSYSLSVTPLQGPTGGALTMGVAGLEWSADVNQPLPQGIPTGPLPFSLVPACFNGPNAVEDRSKDTLPFIVRNVTGGLEVVAIDGSRLGAVTLSDALGRLVATSQVNSDQVVIPVTGLGAYVLQVGQERIKLFAGAQ